MGISASMGPRAFAHGDMAQVAGACRHLPGFNGAAGFRPRRRDRVRVEVLKPSEASMGPRAFAHGDKILAVLDARREDSFNGAAGFRPRRPNEVSLFIQRQGRLQWGRGLSPTETKRVEPNLPRLLCFNGAAGFRPRRREGAPSHRQGGARASMGPRAFAHGDHTNNPQPIQTLK